MSDVQRASIDLSLLRETFGEWGLEEHEIEDLVGVFLTDVPEGFVKLRDAVASGDPTTISREAHALKSPAATMGAHRLADIMLSLETFDPATAAASVEGWFVDAEREFDSVRNQLMAEFPALARG